MKTDASLFLRLVTVPDGWWWLPITPAASFAHENGRDLSLYDHLVFNSPAGTCVALGTVTMEASKHYCRAWAGRHSDPICHVYLGIGPLDEMRRAVQEWLYNRLWDRPGPLPFGITVHDLGILQADDLVQT